MDGCKRRGQKAFSVSGVLLLLLLLFNTTRTTSGVLLLLLNTTRTTSGPPSTGAGVLLLFNTTFRGWSRSCSISLSQVRMIRICGPSQSVEYLYVPCARASPSRYR